MFDRLTQRCRPSDWTKQAVPADAIARGWRQPVGQWHLLQWGLAVALICAVPFALILAGVDFSSNGATRFPTDVAHFTPEQLSESMFEAFSGSLTHTLLEWSAVCTALFVCLLAVVRFRMTLDPSLPVIGMALLCGGLLDAFHMLVSDRLAATATHDVGLAQFTWLTGRMFNSATLLVVIGVFGFVAEDWLEKRKFVVTSLMSAGLFVAACATIRCCLTLNSVPDMVFADALIPRPFDLLPVVGYAACGLFAFPRYLERRRTVVAYSLLLSLIPEVAAQFYMAFGSVRWHDAPFNVAHALKTLAYGVPMIGLMAEFIQTHEHREQATTELQQARDRLETRVMERTAELERINSALAEGEARTRAIVESAAEGIICIDEHGVIESFNAAASRIFGYRPEEVLGRNVSLLIPEPHGEQHDEYLARYSRTREPRILGMYRELDARRSDGTVFTADVAVSEVQVGERRTYTGIIRDLTEGKKLQVQLTQAQKLESIGQLAAGLAHEINTPIQFVADNTRFLRDAFRDLTTFLDHYDQLLQAIKVEAVTPQVVESVQAALTRADPAYLKREVPLAIQESLEGVDHIAKIVRAMKDFARADGGKKTHIDLNESIRNTIAVSVSEWRGVAEMATELDPEMPMVACLPSEINQVIVHLIVNAAHAIADVVGQSGEKGRITVSTLHDDESVEIRVSDTGGGIPPDVQPRIFDPFYTTKEVGRGTGQGLHVCYTVVVKEHGGTIDFETGADGTVFVVRLPIEDRPSMGSSVHAEAAQY